LRLSSRLRHILTKNGMIIGKTKADINATKEYLNTKLADDIWLIASTRIKKDTVRSVYVKNMKP